MINNLVIFGDSYSTYKDRIPDGYAFYYCDGGRNPDESVSDMLCEQTWWSRFIEKTGAKLIRNDSWSGSTICYSGYSGDCSHSSSFIYRYRTLLSDGFFEKNRIDTVIVFGGTNDSWSDAPLGEEQYSGWQESDLFSVRPAICHFLCTLRENHPDVRLIVVGNCKIKGAVVECLKNAAARVGAEYVGLHDIDRIGGHPTVLGMEQIFQQMLEQIEP